MPGRAVQQSNFAAATGRCGAERHCLNTPQLLFVTCHHIGVGTATNKGGCATASRTWAQQPSTGLEAKRQPCSSGVDAAAAGSAKTTSVIDTINRQALC